MNRLNRLIATSLFVLGLGSLLVNIAQAEMIVMTEAQKENLGISVKAIEIATSGLTKRYSAEVQIPTSQERLVSAPQQGLIDVMHVAAGQDVKKGQVLAHLISPDMVVLQREYLQAQTRKQLADKSLARDSILLKDGIIPERRYIETQSQHEELAALLAQQKQSLRLAGMGDGAIAKLSNTKGMQSGVAIIAPISGVVLEQMVTVGQRVDPAMPLYRIANLNTLWLELHVPVEDARNISLGMMVSVPKLKAQGHVIAILRSVNKASQATKVRVEIKQGANYLSPGQLLEAEVKFNVDTKQSGSLWLVPKAALARNGQQALIYLEVKQGFAPILVDLISEQGELAIVKGALIPEDKVVVKGIVALKGAALGMGGE